MASTTRKDTPWSRSWRRSSLYSVGTFTANRRSELTVSCLTSVDVDMGEDSCGIRDHKDTDIYIRRTILFFDLDREYIQVTCDFCI
jgi:hypothetical protein